MRSLAAIRTNKWTEEEDRLLASLRPAFGQDLAVVFHNRPAGFVPPLPVIDLTDEWIARQGLVAVPDWGWRCGDYAYYALRAARPEYEHYWLIEPDVYFSGPANRFFRSFDDVRDDVLGYQLAPFTRDMRFARGLPNVTHFRAIFALTRFSGAALDRLFALRKQSKLGQVGARDYPNDELFCFSHSVAEGFVCGRLEDHAADWFADTQFAPDPDILFDLIDGTAQTGKVIHPVRSRAEYKRALARRLAGHVGILGKCREAIDIFDDSEIEEVSSHAADIFRKAMIGTRDQRARRRHRQGKPA